MSIRIASIRGNDKLAKKEFWMKGFRSQGDQFIRYLDTNFDSTEVDCFIQFNILNPYRLEGNFRTPLYKKILDSKKPYIVWEEGSFRQYPHYKKAGWYHYNNTGLFNNEHVDNTRWKKVVKENKIKIKDWRKSGEYILIMGQVEKDSALISLYDKGYKTFVEWIDYIVTEIRKYTDRPIVIRPHPRDLSGYISGCKSILEKNKNVSISKNFPILANNSVSGGQGILEDLKNAYCVVTYNSNSIVEAICEGVPVFALDNGSVSYDVAHTDLSLIENLNYNIDITAWCSKVAYTMWNQEEIEKGETWAHLKPVFFK